MRRKTRIVAAAAITLILVSAALWYFESPVWTLSRMKAAAQARDPDALSAYIDYPSLREDFKSELRARMMAAAQRDRSGLGGVGVAIGSAMVGPLVDSLISPAGVRAAMLAKRDEAVVSGAAGPMKALQMPDKPVITRRSFSEFIVGSKDQSDSGLVFRLHGLSWKLSGVELPPE